MNVVWGEVLLRLMFAWRRTLKKLHSKIVGFC